MSNTQQIATSGPGPNWVPSRKIWAGGLSFVAAWVLLQGASAGAAAINARYGFPVVVPQDPATLTAVAAGISYVVQYFVPPAVRDVIAQVNGRLAGLAQTDKDVATALITAASNAPATQIVTTQQIATASPPSNVVSNVTNKVVSQ